MEQLQKNDWCWDCYPDMAYTPRDSVPISRLLRHEETSGHLHNVLRTMEQQPDGSYRWAHDGSLVRIAEEEGGA